MVELRLQYHCVARLVLGLVAREAPRNAEYDFLPAKRSMPFSQNMPFLSRGHLTERSTPFLKTVDAIAQNDCCHFSERSLAFKMVDAISQNGRCDLKRLMSFLKTVVVI